MSINLLENIKIILCSNDIPIKTQFMCNNSLYGGDCYGDTYCSNYDSKYKTLTKLCTHEDFECINCYQIICGCCYDNITSCLNCGYDNNSDNSIDCDFCYVLIKEEDYYVECCCCSNILCYNCKHKFSKYSDKNNYYCDDCLNI